MNGKQQEHLNNNKNNSNLRSHFLFILIAIGRERSAYIATDDDDDNILSSSSMLKWYIQLSVVFYRIDNDNDIPTDFSSSSKRDF